MSQMAVPCATVWKEDEEAPSGKGRAQQFNDCPAHASFRPGGPQLMSPWWGEPASPWLSTKCTSSIAVCLSHSTHVRLLPFKSQSLSEEGHSCLPILDAAVQPQYHRPPYIWMAGGVLGGWGSVLRVPSSFQWGIWKLTVPSLWCWAGLRHRAGFPAACSVLYLCRSRPCLSGRRRVSSHGGLFSLLSSTSQFIERGGGSESSSGVMGCQARWLGEGGQEEICFWDRQMDSGLACSSLWGGRDPGNSEDPAGSD